MTFHNYVCWKSENIQPILNIEAIQPQDHIFLATHHPLKMKKSQSIQEIDEITYTEQDCLRDFLAPDDFAFVPILGTSGTGKSHLIRWLAVNIKSTEKRKVLLIPKLGTNLKDILSMILNLPELEGEKFSEYRQRLSQVSSSLTEKEARQHLLNQLAVSVGDNENRDYRQLTEEQQYLVDNLPSLLYDPYFRQEYWLKDGGIIHRLITHIFGYKDQVKNGETRREFRLEDIPFKVLDLHKAGRQAYDFYSYLISDDSLKKATINWLNKHLDEAITKVLNLGREDLQILMREVRATLAKQGIELVLLIEDFAKLQGIDREVLDAVLARPQQAESQPLCAIRTALACTTGYFNGLIQSFDTVKQRITFKVSLDLGEVGDKSLVTERDIQAIVARYLNAIRHQDQTLKDWLQDYQNKGQPPSFCDQCQHRQNCHTGFGEINGMGLYPFTPIALRQMRKRVNPDNFNPRILIKDVLKYTLENSINDLQQGRFPSLLLREHFGKTRLSAITQDDIQKKDPQNAYRRQILIDLWTDSDTLCDLPPQIHTAFNLPPLGVKVMATQRTLTLKEKPVTYQVSPKIADKLTEKIEILNKWNNQGILPQSLEKDIREFVYPAVCEHIEWNTEMLLQSQFTGSHSIFKQRNVLIYSPRMRGEGANYSGIVLRLPINPDDSKEFRETAIAFQGILLYNYHKHWNFEDGDRYFRIYAKYLDRWSHHILEQIRRHPRLSGVYWDPVPATVELLAIAVQMAGLPTNTPEELINSLFLEMPDLDHHNRGSSWQSLYKFLKGNKSKLLEILKIYIGCTKGNSYDFQIIDTVQIIEPLKSIRKSWNPQETIPDDLNKEYEVIKKVRQKVDQLLSPALQEEWDHHLSVYNFLVSEFGEFVNKDMIINTINEAINKSQEAGILGQKDVEGLQDLVKKFRKTNFMNYINGMQKLVGAGLPRPYEINSPDIPLNRALPLLSQNHQNVIEITEEFTQKCNEFLDNSLNRVKEEISKLETHEKGQSMAILYESIEDSLLDLQDLLKEIRD